MTERIEASAIKERVTLRSLLDRCGIEVKRSGAAWTANCPFHREKTSSFIVHESADGDWYKCFGCGAGGDIFTFWKEFQNVTFPAAVETLAAIAGLSLGHVPAPMPRRVVEDAPDAPVDPLAGEDVLTWERACAELYTDTEELQRMAAWRGYRPEVVDWAARRGLIGRLVNRSHWREAFAIQRPVEVEGGGWGLENIGWHVRLAPGTRGNADPDKASWRYEPRTGLGAWPFVVLPAGGIEAVKYLFCTEGQWDALAMVDLMNWHQGWPAGVGLFGMRGASSWKRVLSYALSPAAVAFLIADRDDAGRGWFVKTKQTAVPFHDALQPRVRQVYGFWPDVSTGKKDLNDLLKILGENGRTLVRAALRKKIQVRERPRPRGPTFFVWLKRQKGRVDAIGDMARWAMVREAPRGRIRQSEWKRFFQQGGATEEIFVAFNDAWREWSDSTGED